MPKHPEALSENELWLLSFYRTSEIAGALFFGRIARSVKPGPLQVDITHHFADEANHARWWSECIADLGAGPLNLGRAYQDDYLSAAGIPANVMEVLAITQVFEKRAIGLYNRHLKVADPHPRIAATLHRIMVDERWHIQYVRAALREQEAVHGPDQVDATLKRFDAADDAVFAKLIDEHGERFPHMAADPVPPAAGDAG
jgi:hypothetical protein